VRVDQLSCIVAMCMLEWPATVQTDFPLHPSGGTSVPGTGMLPPPGALAGPADDKPRFTVPEFVPI
jgi:hypothetical protein